MVPLRRRRDLVIALRPKNATLARSAMMATTMRVSTRVTPLDPDLESGFNRRDAEGAKKGRRQLETVPWRLGGFSSFSGEAVTMGDYFPAPLAIFSASLI